MMELGPFRVNSDGKSLSHNEYAWNNGNSFITFTKHLVTFCKETTRNSCILLDIICLCSGKYALLGISSRSWIFLFEYIVWPSYEGRWADSCLFIYLSPKLVWKISWVQIQRVLLGRWKLCRPLYPSACSKDPTIQQEPDFHQLKRTCCDYHWLKDVPFHTVHLYIHACSIFLFSPNIWQDIL